MVDLRRELLLKVKDSINETRYLEFQIALAIQSHLNGFIYEETIEETKAVKSLERIIENSLSKNINISYYQIACLASYRPLIRYAWSNLLNSDSELSNLLERQIFAVQREKELSKTIPKLREVDDSISIAVKRLYEENPYPQWHKAALQPKPISLERVISIKKLQKVPLSIDVNENINILVAGCGTGQQPLETACLYKNSVITAVDLSINSISYAQRKAQELNIRNVKFVQADILDLELLDTQFDIIQSTGVLHHMEKPFDGWKILTKLLKPKGLMNIGLYSKLGRKDSIEARAIIQKHGLDFKRGNLLKFRKQIIDGKFPQLGHLQHSRSFFDESSLRDALFHVKEHHFTIPQIDEILSKLKLRFIGFEFADKRINKSFEATHTGSSDLYDLNKWHDFELENTSTFNGMYQFWVQNMREQNYK